MKIDGLMEYTAQIELERDELRECVAAFVEKSEFFHREMMYLRCRYVYTACSLTKSFVLHIHSRGH